MDKPKRKYVRKNVSKKSPKKAEEEEINLKIDIPPIKNIEILDKYPDVTDIEHPELRDKIINVLNGIF